MGVVEIVVGGRSRDRRRRTERGATGGYPK
jgi:hypothetical protein